MGLLSADAVPPEHDVARSPALAHIAVYFAVLAPLFWAPVFVRTPEHLARLLWLLLICCGINSVVGVLQVYDPARWMPAEFSRVMTENGGRPRARSATSGRTAS